MSIILYVFIILFDEMEEIKNKELLQYYYNCYTKVDGLWFIKVEEEYGFNKALEIDRKVWEILPKIQARFLKSKLKVDQGMDALLECIKIKMRLDKFKFEIKKINQGKDLKIVVDQCPWHNTMIKSGRENLSQKVGSAVCSVEYSVWAKEFGDNIGFEIKDRICKGSKCCTLFFYDGY